MEKNNAIKWLWQVTGKHKLYVAALILVQGIYGGSGVLYALLLRDVVDSAVQKNRSGFFHSALLTGLLMAGQVLLLAIRRRLEEQSRATLENRFKGRLLENILHRDYASVSAVHSAEWLNRLTNDCALVAEHFTEILPGLAGMVVKMLSAGIMLLVLSPRFALVMMPLAAVLLLLTAVFRRILKRLHRNIQEADGRLRIFLQERIGALMILRSFGAEPQTETEAGVRMDAHKDARMKKNRFSNLCNIGFQGGMQCMYLAGVCYCGWGMLQGTISFGTLTAVTQLIGQIQTPFANITGYLPKYYAMTASTERLMEIEQFAPDTGAAPQTPEAIRRFYGEKFSAIGLEHVNFTYLPAAETVGVQTKEAMPVVLHDVSIQIKKGEYAAFTGHSGCGKSTVLKLLMCIYHPDSGVRYAADRSGERHLLDAAWHRLFAYVPQGNQLMSGTIREIVSFAEPGAAQDEERLQRALKIACADEFVNALEAGADTLLGELGTGLSEGQMQRIAVARAVFSEGPVLLLDEATSALDERTERQLLENLREMTDKTVIIVTHRPAALEICDRIYCFTPDGIREQTVSGTETDNTV